MAEMELPCACDVDFDRAKVISPCDMHKAWGVQRHEAGRREGVGQVLLLKDAEGFPLAVFDNDEVVAIHVGSIRALLPTPPPQAAEPPGCTRTTTGCCPCPKCGGAMFGANLKPCACVYGAPPAVPAGEEKTKPSPQCWCGRQHEGYRS